MTTASKMYDREFVVCNTASGTKTLGHGLFMGSKSLFPHHVIINWKWDPGAGAKLYVTRADSTNIYLAWSNVTAPAVAEVVAMPIHSFQATPDTPWNEGTVSPRAQ